MQTNFKPSFTGVEFSYNGITKTHKCVIFNDKNNKSNDTVLINGSVLGKSDKAAELTSLLNQSLTPQVSKQIKADLYEILTNLDTSSADNKKTYVNSNDKDFPNMLTPRKVFEQNKEQFKNMVDIDKPLTSGVSKQIQQFLSEIMDRCSYENERIRNDKDNLLTPKEFFEQQKGSFEKAIDTGEVMKNTSNNEIIFENPNDYSRDQVEEFFARRHTRLFNFYA